jgi:hypothetical protein
MLVGFLGWSMGRLIDSGRVSSFRDPSRLDCIFAAMSALCLPAVPTECFWQRVNRQHYTVVARLGVVVESTEWSPGEREIS